MKKFLITVVCITLAGCFIYSYLTRDETVVPTDTPSSLPQEMKDELEDLGFTKTQISIIRSKLTLEEIETLKTLDNKEYLVDYIEYDYFKFENLSKYLEYDKNTDYDKNTIIMHVNIGIDNPFYTNIKTVDNPYDKLVLVNKYNALPSGISPQDLTTIGDSSNPKGCPLDSTAASNLVSMFTDAANNGHTLYIVSGYRSEATQINLYNYYVRTDSQENADTYSARPNHSEHQTGLAADIGICANCLDDFDTTDAYAWVLANAHKYGFIERYPKDKTYLTGYDYEPWHYRYVGVDVATIIHDEGITFEEYYVKYMED